MAKQMTVGAADVDMQIIADKGGEYLLDPFLRPPVCLMLTIVTTTAMLTRESHIKQQLVVSIFRRIYLEWIFFVFYSNSSVTGNKLLSDT